MKLIDNQANIQAIRKISTLFEMTAMEVDELLGTVMETARAIVGAKNASLLLVQNEKNQKVAILPGGGEKHRSTARY